MLTVVDGEAFVTTMLSQSGELRKEAATAAVESPLDATGAICRKSPKKMKRGTPPHSCSLWLRSRRPFHSFDVFRVCVGRFVPYVGSGKEVFRCPSIMRSKVTRYMNLVEDGDLVRFMRGGTIRIVRCNASVMAFKNSGPYCPTACAAGRRT